MVFLEYSQSQPSSKAQVAEELEMEVVCQFSDSPKQRWLFFFSFHLLDSLDCTRPILSFLCLQSYKNLISSIKRTANHKPLLYHLYLTQLTYHLIPLNSTPWWSAGSFSDPTLLPSLSLPFNRNVLMHAFIHSSFIPSTTFN